MSGTLPPEALKYIDPASPTETLRRLTHAVEAGEIDLSALAVYAKAAANGTEARFSRMSPVPLEMIEAIRANPDLPPRQVVYAGLRDGLWSYEDVERFEANEEVLSRRASGAGRTVRRGVYMTRNRRRGSFRPRTENRYVPAMSLDVLARPGLSDGARQCLSVIMSIAGKRDHCTTYTSAIATQMGRTSRCVRNYYIALEEAGLITRRAGKHYNTVFLTVSPDCRPAPYREPLDVKAFKLARSSDNPALHLLAMSVVFASVDAHQGEFTTPDRRNGISAFKSESESLRRRFAENPLHHMGRPLQPSRTADRLAPPTSHSTLLVDPSRPINHERIRHRNGTGGTIHRAWQASPVGMETGGCNDEKTMTASWV